MTRTTLVSVAVLAGMALAALVPLHAGGADEGGKTAATTTAEAGFAALRKAAAEKDEATLSKCLPTSLVKDWTRESAEDGKAWRAALAAQIAEGTVEKVTESGDDAIARWKSGTPPTTWALRLRRDGGVWIAASPWAYGVAGGALAKANGAKPARVKLKMRTDKDKYGPSAWSFTHVTADPEKCLNRLDVWYCSAGHLHGHDAMISPIQGKDLAAIEGLQPGGDWMDQADPKEGKLYVVDCKSADRSDFQVVLQVVEVKGNALEFDWRLVAAGKNAPADIHKVQPLVSNDGKDGVDGWCGK